MKLLSFTNLSRFLHLIPYKSEAYYVLYSISFFQDMYGERFPELPGMIPEPSVYLKTVNILGNDIDAGLKKLDEVLTAQTILIVTVTASTTSGKVGLIKNKT